MRGKVKRLRVHGRRLSNIEISRAEPVEGELRLDGQQWTMEYVLALRRPNDNASAPLMQLFAAQLVTMHGDGMLFRGIERPQGDDGPAYVQEWSVMIGER